MPFSSPEEDGEPFVEVDPSGRFGRYRDLLGHGSVKNVHRAFDLEEGRDVAWNQIKLSKFMGNPCIISKIHSEIELLKTLKNENIIVLYHFWKDDHNNILNFITEACASGNLRDYRKKHRHVSVKALKMWSRQILQGLDYLHTHDPCVIHRDLNCSNIFINGNIGKVFYSYKYSHHKKKCLVLLFFFSNHGLWLSYIYIYTRTGFTEYTPPVSR